MDFVLRSLEFEDIFTMTTILSKIGADELKDCFSNIDIAKLAKGKNDNVLEKWVCKLSLTWLAFC